MYTESAFPPLLYVHEIIFEYDTTDNEIREKPLLERQKEDTFDYEQYSSITRNNHEQTTLIWLDSQLGQTTQFADDFRRTIEMIRELNDYVLLFSDEKECLDHIESIKNETVLLIVAGSSASSYLLDKTNNMGHVDSIFIFCQDKNAYEYLLLNKDYHKLMGVFNERSTLASSIANSIDLVDKKSTIFAFYNTNKQKSARNLTKESGSFIFSQLVKQVLQKMSLNEHAMKTSKQEMLDKCRLYYRGNKKAMEEINRFEDKYIPDQAIKWYTDNSFLYRLVNKALRIEDIDALYAYRFYINDLCQCLAEQSKLLYESTISLHLYRGVKMSINEINRFYESVGHLISVNAFFSTSRQLDVSEVYAGVESIKTSDELGSVVFYIDVILKECPHIVFADVTNLSKFKYEDEVLFDIGTVFKIQSMKFNEHRQYWQCQLIASNEGSTTVKEYFDIKQNELNESNDIECTFGDLLFEMGEWFKSRTYFQKLAEFRPTDPYVLFCIGRSHCKIGESKQALSYFNGAYDLCTKNSNEQQLSLAAKICSYICRVHRDCSNHKDAFTFGNQAIKFFQQVNENKNQLNIAQVLIEIGIIYYEQSNDDASLESFQHAYSIVKNTYAFDHPLIGDCLHFLAFAYYHIGDYDKSLDCVIKSLAIDQKLLPADHPSIWSAQNNIAKQHYKQGKYEQALEEFYQVAEFYLHSENYDHRNCAKTYNNIGKALYRLNKLDEADTYYEKALHIIKELFSSTSDHIDLAYTLKNMGETQLARGNTINSLQLFERAHNMYERIFVRNGNHRDIAKCKYLIARTHVQLGNDKEAADEFGKALLMWTNVLSKDHPDFALCHRSMGEFYVTKKKEKMKAITHFRMALSIYEKRLPSDHFDLIDIKQKVNDLENCQELIT